MNMKIVGISVAVLVSLVVLAGVLMPILDDATTTEDTFTNVGQFYVEADPAEAYTIVFDKAATDPLLINGESMSVVANYTILALDKSILRCADDNTLQYKGNGSYIVNIAKLNLTISSGSITGTYRLTTTADADPDLSWPTTTYTKAYVASLDEENYIMTTYTQPVKMNGDSEIFAFGQTLIAGVLRLVTITGNIDDGVTVSVLNNTSGEPASTVTVSDLAINYTPVSGHEDLYELTSITFKATESGTTTDVTYSAYIVPSEVTAERSEHLSGNQIELLDVIPVLVIVAILLGVIALVIRSRLD